ncbi:hypothetical protein BD413DRAFT_31492 [Trametes elegans]|nr:hypothetical protein BD413DRAFT_31492 [Trametes elegans]
MRLKPGSAECSPRFVSDFLPTSVFKSPTIAAMFSTKLFAALATLVAAAASASAAAPSKVLHPALNETWVIHQARRIVWDTSDIPDTTITGDILLGYRQPNSNDEHLDTEHPVATNVPITAGEVVVPVPEVAEGSTYFVKLFNSDDYVSDQFIIKSLAGW